jgi:hypothetical protein
MEVSGQLHAPTNLLPGKGPQVPTEGWVGLRVGLDAVTTTSFPNPMVQEVVNLLTELVQSL